MSMFWGRASSTMTGSTDTTVAQSVLQTASSRSSGFFAALDILGSSESRSTGPNQSAGENAREDINDVPQSNGASHNSDDETGNDAHPTFTLSEQRRQELLQAARANRTTWIDGESPTDSSIDSSSWQRCESTAKVPVHCQQAIDLITMDMRSLLTSLEELKRRIIPNDVVYTTTTDANDDANNQSSHELVTIADELRAKRAELESWRRVHVTEAGVSFLQRKRMTASDKEILFLLAYQELLAILKHPMAAEIVYQVQVFVSKFAHWNLEAMLQQRALPDRPGGHVQSFIDKLVHQVQRTNGPAVFASLSIQILSLDEDEDQLLHEVLEAFLMEKLYTTALTPSSKAEADDELLREHLESLDFVEFCHLDLPVPSSHLIHEEWTRLADELRLLSAYVSPRRKMDCVLRVCQQLTALLSSQHPKGKLPSADEFLPGLIYLLLKANPPQLKRNVHLILEYRRPSRLVSEPGYFFTHLVSSVAFLEQVNGDLLTITPEEFEHGLQRSKNRVVEETTAVATKESVLDTTRVTQCGTLQPTTLRLPTVLEIRARRLSAINGTACV